MGTYTVTFDVLVTYGWSMATGLAAGTLTINPAPKNIAVNVGYSHTVALKEDGTIWAWGLNDGMLGDGSMIPRLKPAKTVNDSDWAVVDAGTIHTVALKKDGTLWAWGRNNDGKLGDGITTERHSPIQIGTDTDWAAVSAGSTHTAALKEDGSIWTWGDNYYGQLGNGTDFNDNPNPAQVDPAP